MGNMTDRQIHRLSARAMPFGNGYHLTLPKSWENKIVYCLLKDEYDMVRDQMQNLNVGIVDYKTGDD